MTERTGGGSGWETSASASDPTITVSRRFSGHLKVSFIHVLNCSNEPSNVEFIRIFIFVSSSPMTAPSSSKRSQLVSFATWDPYTGSGVSRRCSHAVGGGTRAPQVVLVRWIRMA